MQPKPSVHSPVSFKLLVVLFIFAALVRIWPSLQPAVWFDEVFSIYYVQKGMDAIWGADWRLDPTPPLYYTLLHFWVSMVGTSEWLLRSLSLFFSSVTVCVIYYFGRELKGHHAGIIAAIVWAILPLPIDYGVEIRAYALEGLLMAFAFWQLTRIVGVLLDEDDKSWREVRAPAILLTLTGIFLTYTHITAIFPYGAMVMAVGVIVLARAPRLLLPWVGLNAVYLLAIIPQIVASIAVIQGNAPTLAWLQPPSLTGLWGILTPLMTGELGNKLMSHILAALWIALLCTCLWRLRRDRGALIVLVFVPATALIAFIIFSRFQPALLTRTVVWCTIPLAALVGAGLSTIDPPRRGWRMTAAVIFVIASSSVFHLKHRSLARGDAAGIELLGRNMKGDGIIALLDGELGCEFAYYEPDLQNQIRLSDTGFDREFVRTQRVDLGCNTPPVMNRDQIISEARAGKTIWLVGRTPFYGNGARIRRDLARFQDNLARELVPKLTIENGSFIAVGLVSARDSADAR